MKLRGVGPSEFWQISDWTTAGHACCATTRGLRGVAPRPLSVNSADVRVGDLAPGAVVTGASWHAWLSPRVTQRWSMVRPPTANRSQRRRGCPAIASAGLLKASEGSVGGS